MASALEGGAVEHRDVDVAGDGVCVGVQGEGGPTAQF